MGIGDLLMKEKFFLALIVLTLVGCKTTEPAPMITDPVEIDKLFNAATKLSCGFKHPKNDNYCGCFAQTLTDVTPAELKISVGSSNSTALQKKLTRVALANRKKLKECDPLYVEDLTIPKTSASDALKKILKENQGNILSPSDALNIIPSNLDLGYEYGVQNITPNRDGSLGKPRMRRLTKIDGDDYIFSILDENGEIKNKDIILWRKGVMFTWSESLKEYRPLHSDHRCKFVIGVCEYKVAGKQTKKLNTEYKNGVWVRNTPGFSKSRNLVKEVYDKNGLPLYKYHKASGYSEVVRIK